MARLRDLWGDPALTVEAMAATLGCCSKSVGLYARQWGLPPRRGGYQVRLDPDRLARLWRAGVSIREIASHLGCGATTIQRAARCAGLPPRPVGVPAALTLAQFLQDDLAARMQRLARRERAAQVAVGMMAGRHGRALAVAA